MLCGEQRCRNSAVNRTVDNCFRFYYVILSFSWNLDTDINSLSKLTLEGRYVKSDNCIFKDVPIWFGLIDINLFLNLLKYGSNYSEIVK